MLFLFGNLSRKLWDTCETTIPTLDSRGIYTENWQQEYGGCCWRLLWGTLWSEPDLSGNEKARWKSQTCHIHNLLQDLCISESIEGKFIEVHSDVNFSPMSESRRISIHYANYPYISSSPCEPSNSRSIIGLGGLLNSRILLMKATWNGFAKVTSWFRW